MAAFADIKTELAHTATLQVPTGAVLPLALRQQHIGPWPWAGSTRCQQLQDRRRDGITHMTQIVSLGRGRSTISTAPLLSLSRRRRRAGARQLLQQVLDDVLAGQQVGAAQTLVGQVAPVAGLAEGHQQRRRADQLLQRRRNRCASWTNPLQALRWRLGRAWVGVSALCNQDLAGPAAGSASLPRVKYQHWSLP